MAALLKRIRVTATGDVLSAVGDPLTGVFTVAGAFTLAAFNVIATAGSPLIGFYDTDATGTMIFEWRGSDTDSHYVPTDNQGGGLHFPNKLHIVLADIESLDLYYT